MITKVLQKVSVSYLYTQIKYRSIYVYIKNKKGRGAYIMLLKKLFFSNIFPLNKKEKTKTNEEG